MPELFYYEIADDGLTTLDDGGFGDDLMNADDVIGEDETRDDDLTATIDTDEARDDPYSSFNFQVDWG